MCHPGFKLSVDDKASCKGSLSFMCNSKFNCINELAYIIINAACILLADCDVLWLQMLMNAKLTMEDALSCVSTRAER